MGAVSIDQISTYLYKTARHELGHLLGLAHQFDGTRSIMSYEKEDVEIYDYDIEAIQELYPLCYGKENGFDCESI